MLGRPPRLNLNEPLFHEPPRFLSDPVVVAASGKDWRLTKEYVLNFLEGRSQPLAAPAEAVKAPAAAPVPAAAPAAGKREERVRLTKLRQTIARRLKEAQNTAAILTTFNECDMSAVMALRTQYKDGFEKKHGVKLGFSSFFTKAVVGALQELPAANARIEGEIGRASCRERVCQYV